MSRYFWTLRRNLPTGFLPSSQLSVVSVRSSNITKSGRSVPLLLAIDSLLAIQRRQGEGRTTYTMAEEAER